MVDCQIVSSQSTENQTTENQSSQQIRVLCADLLNKTREFTKSFDANSEPTSGAVEYWQNYRKRLATYDRAFEYPGSINPVKCAIKGWTYMGNGTIQCVECQESIQLTVPDFQSADDVNQVSLDILKELRGRHTSLCSFHAAFHHSIILHSVPDLLASIQANIPSQPFKSEEIADEFANLCHVAVIEHSFALYFAIAGWFVRKDKSLFCKLCLQTVNPIDHSNSMMDPLKLHYDYCPLLESYPQWKLALEDYVYSNSNPSSISENFALIQRQLAISGLSSKVPVYETLNDTNDEEMPSVHEVTEAGTLDLNRTLESMHEAPSQNADTLEPALLRDTDFEADIQQESIKRKRVRQERDEESPLAKRSHLPFPHNYLQAYGQQTGNVKPIVIPVLIPVPVDNQSNNQLMDMRYNEGLSIDDQSPDDFQQDLQQKDDSILSPDSENQDDSGTEMVGHEVLEDEDVDRLPVHEGGEREAYDSGDQQSADDRDSYNDDEATTDEERIEEQEPYDEPEQFADDSREADNIAYDSAGEQDGQVEPEEVNKNVELNNDSDQEQSVGAESFGAEDDYEEYSDVEENEPQDANNDSDSDIIILDD